MTPEEFVQVARAWEGEGDLPKPQTVWVVTLPYEGTFEVCASRDAAGRWIDAQEHPEDYLAEEWAVVR